jgi:phage protein D/phage baseplate assembly protein gpV
MPKTADLVSKIYLSLDGTEVPRPVMQQIESLTVSQHSHLPDFFTITFNDPDLKLLDEGPFDLTKTVEIKASDQQDQKVALIKGEITALEPSFQEGMIAQLVVRGYDKSHRLYRDTRSTAFLNKKDSDLASEIAQRGGLQSEIDSTSTVYDHIYQHNQTDLEFLLDRAWRIGYECFVSDGKLTFRKPPTGKAASKLTWGQELLTFQPRMNLAEQVDEVLVRGWDPKKKEAIVGKSKRGQLYPKVKEPKDGAEWARTFGNGRLVIVDQPVISQAEADSLASARLDEISGAFIEAQGMAFRTPQIRAGQIVEVAGIGERFSGAYLVTEATHNYSARGLFTTFSVRGTRSGLLSEQLHNQTHIQRWPGLVIGLVTNTDDPEKWGRVKLKFPWMTEDSESDWARVMGIGAGPETGFFVLPEVGDEVLVAFAHGNFNQPYVLGGLWNGVDGLPPEASGAPFGEMPKVRTWHARSGAKIVMHDTSDKKIEIVTADGRSVTLDDQNKTITVKTSGVKLELKDSAISVESQGEVSVKAQSNLKIEASGNIDIKAGGQVNVKGAMVNLN